MNRPLWPDGENHAELAENWQRLRKNLTSGDENWSFWIDWYERHLHGKPPQDWPLLGKIALIPEEDWEKGAGHVNLIIARLSSPSRVKTLANSLPNAETIQRNPDTGLFEAIPAEIEQKTRFRNAINKVRESLDDLDDYRTINEPLPLDFYTKKLRKKMDRYAGEALPLHDAFEAAYHGLCQTCPSSETPFGQAVAELINDLQTGFKDLRDDPEVDKTVRSRVRRKPHLSSVEAADSLAPVIESVAQDSDAKLKETLGANFELIRQPLSAEEISDERVSEERANALYDTISKSAKVQDIRHREETSRYQTIVDAADDARKLGQGGDVLAKTSNAILDFVSTYWPLG
ncbi:hypothetical protein GO499_07140 [Algicella marina]|uniref:Uncharacterized protein n=2 Tax=Algicella marina TaxID=2683284 RepID=A0A6P1T0M4_9RHOB|nr:hypothetical protein GO499_07140 [Algicella marina]